MDGAEQSGAEDGGAELLDIPSPLDGGGDFEVTGVGELVEEERGDGDSCVGHVQVLVAGVVAASPGGIFLASILAPCSGDGSGRNPNWIMSWI